MQLMWELDLEITSEKLGKAGVSSILGLRGGRQGEAYLFRLIANILTNLLDQR